MSTRKGRKMGEAEAKLKAFRTAHKGKTLTDAQKETLNDLRTAAQDEKYRRLANVQLDRCFKSIVKLGMLAKLAHPKDALETLKKHFSDKLNEMAEKYEAKAKKSEPQIAKIF